FSSSRKWTLLLCGAPPHWSIFLTQFSAVSSPSTAAAASSFGPLAARSAASGRWRQFFFCRQKLVRQILPPSAKNALQRPPDRDARATAGRPYVFMFCA